ncbi:hypothetical protein ACHQM5_009884 [Ranunculus cassubicifolius]
MAQAQAKRNQLSRAYVSGGKLTMLCLYDRHREWERKEESGCLRRQSQLIRQDQLCCVEDQVIQSELRRTLNLGDLNL